MKRRKDRRRTTRVIDSCPNEIFTYANGVLSAYLAVVLATYFSSTVFYTTGMMTLRATRESNGKHRVPAELFLPKESR